MSVQLINSVPSSIPLNLSIDPHTLDGLIRSLGYENVIVTDRTNFSFIKSEKLIIAPGDNKNYEMATMLITDTHNFQHILERSREHTLILFCSKDKEFIKDSKIRLAIIE